MAITPYTFFGPTSTGLGGYEMQQGGAGQSGGNVLANYPYGEVADAGRGTGGKGLPDSAGARVFVELEANLPAELRGRGNAVHVWIRQNDGAYAIASADPGNDFSQVKWYEGQRITRQSDLVYASGPYAGLARPAALLPADDGANGSTLGLLGTEIWYGWSMALRADWPTHLSGWCFIGPEIHHDGGGPAPAWAIDVINDQWRMYVRGGTNDTFFLNRQFYWDDSGFKGWVRGGAGGGGPYFDQNGNAIAATPPAGSNLTDYFFLNRGLLTKAIWYDFALRVIPSDNDPLAGLYANQSSPFCSTPGLIQLFMQKNGGGYLEVIPATPVATAYSAVVNGSRVSQFLWMNAAQIYRARGGNSTDAHLFQTNHKRGGSFADVSFQGGTIVIPGTGASSDTDNANDNSLNNGLHSIASVGTGVTFAEQNQDWEFTVAAASTGNSVQVASASSSLDLTGDRAFIQLVQSGDNGNDCRFRMVAANGDYIAFSITGGNLRCIKGIGGVETVLFTVADNRTTMAYLSVREAAGTTFWETSPDGSTWTQRASAASPVAVSALKRAFSVTSGGVSSTAIFDNLNFVPGTPVSLPTDFAPWTAPVQINATQTRTTIDKTVDVGGWTIAAGVAALVPIRARKALLGSGHSAGT